MERFTNILCATDFSQHCQFAAERAAELARLYGAQLTLLHVVEYFPVDRSNREIAPEDVDPRHYHEERAQRALADLAAQIKRPDCRREVRVHSGSAQHEILDYVAENGVDLVVIASHGRHGITSILGSTTYGLTHKAPCDVLAVRARDS